jgi:CelD/BcsL family acetyltransferase involved in cellulose biosynthesis
VNQLSKAHRTSFDVVSESGKVEKEFEDFRVAHEAQWQAEGKLGHFGDWPNATAFNRDLVRVLGASGLVRFYQIRADDQVVSSQYCFSHGETNYWRLPARVGGEKWDRLSFGRMGLAKMITASIAEGHRVIEGGRGHYGYKIQMGGHEVPLRMVQFVRRGLLVSARVRLFKLSANLLNIAYYKVLFIRLAPKVPALRRPLAKLWIRSTF